MTRRRFYAPSDSIDLSSKRAILEGNEARHLINVLRLRQGDVVFVFDGAAHEFQGTVAEISKHRVEVSIDSEVAPASPESPLRLTLAVALLKGEKLDLVIQKATELGVARVLLFPSEYADVKIRDQRDTERRLERLNRIALEASKQCGRASIPGIEMTLSFDELITAENSGFRLMFSERGGTNFVEHESPSQQNDITALVGPEGGWSDDEIHAAGAAGFHIVTLGGRIMRAETAAISVCAILQHRFGDLN